MNMHNVGAAVAILVSMLAAGALAAQEDDAEHAEHRRHVQQLLRRDQRGDFLDPEEREALDEYYQHALLIRTRLNIRQASHYAIAEIYLKKEDVAKAAEALQKVIADAGGKKGEVVWTTHYNLARMYRRRQRHVQKALAEYEKVRGRWRERAFNQAVAMLQDAGNWENGAKFIEKRLAEAKEEGEKLALLQRLARLYQHADQADRAIAAYERVAKAATPQALRRMEKAAADFVNDTMAQILKNQRSEMWLEAEKLERQLAARERTLREQGRTDEHEAFMKAVHRFSQQAEERERREQREREKRGE